MRAPGRGPAPARAFERGLAAPTLLAAALALAYLLWPDPPGQDLAAAEYRAGFFDEHGFETWSDEWYSGFHLPAYSVLFPPLGALLGVRLAAALAVVAGAAIFAVLAQRWFGGRRALVASLWFAAGAAIWLLTGRMPFLVALPFGLAALLAADGGRLLATGVLAALSALVSPVVGLFAAIAGAAIGLAGRRTTGLVLAGSALTPIAILNLAYPTGGEQPLAFTAFVFIPLLAAIALWLVPHEYRALRIGVVLYAVVALLAFLVPSSLGGNVTRLGALFAGPVLVAVLWPRGRWVVLAVALPLAYWQFVAPLRDLREGAGLAENERVFYQPLIAELDRATVERPAVRIHVPPTLNRWEAAYVAPEYPLARGWLRQLEATDIDLFTDDNLTPETYRAWLAEHEVGYIAVPDAKLDYLAEDEVELIASGLDYLEPVWTSPDWRLYRVETPL